MTPRIVCFHLKAFNKQRKESFDYDNLLAYLQGIYFVEALNATVGNMFKKEHAKPFEYPNKPFDINGEQTEKDLDEQRKAFWESLKVAQINFELSKGE